MSTLNKKAASLGWRPQTVRFISIQFTPVGAQPDSVTQIPSDPRWGWCRPICRSIPPDYRPHPPNTAPPKRDSCLCPDNHSWYKPAVPEVQPVPGSAHKICSLQLPIVLLTYLPPDSTGKQNPSSACFTLKQFREWQ